MNCERSTKLGGGVFVWVNGPISPGGSGHHIVRVRAIWQEDDDGFDGALPLPPSMIVELSPKHFHRYWLVDDVWPADGKGRADFAAVMERMVESYGSDKGAKDISRVLRVPGFLHRKVRDGVVNPFMVHMVEASGRRYTRAQILPRSLRSHGNLNNRHNVNTSGGMMMINEFMTL